MTSPLSGAQSLWIERYLPLVEKIARQHHRMVPRSIDIQDLRQAGRLGLVVAAQSLAWLADTGEEFASAAIRTHIRNFLVGAGHRRQGEMAYAMAAVPLDTADGHRQALDYWRESTAAAERDRATEQALVKAREGLSERQRALLDLVYGQGLSLTQIGTARSVGRGVRTVVKEHTAALKRLRKLLEEAGEDKAA